MDHKSNNNDRSPVGVVDVVSDMSDGAVITQAGTSQSVDIPSIARLVRIATHGGACNIAIGRTADANSHIYVPDESIDYYPVRGDLSGVMSVYGAAGTVYIKFLG